MTSPHLQLWRHEQIPSVWRFSFNRDHVISILNFPVNDLCHDSIGNKLFGFIFSRSHEPIVIGVCGMRSVNQDHRIVSRVDRFWNQALNTQFRQNNYRSLISPLSLRKVFSDLVLWRHHSWSVTSRECRTLALWRHIRRLFSIFISE